MSRKDVPQPPQEIDSEISARIMNGETVILSEKDLPSYKDVSVVGREGDSIHTKTQTGIDILGTARGGLIVNIKRLHSQTVGRGQVAVQAIEGAIEAEIGKGQDKIRKLGKKLKKPSSS